MGPDAEIDISKLLPDECTNTASPNVETFTKLQTSRNVGKQKCINPTWGYMPNTKYSKIFLYKSANIIDPDMGTCVKQQI